MPNGVDRRAQTDTETVKALLLINGGGAVALLYILPSILSNGRYEQFTSTILEGILILMVGLICAIVHNLFRGKCSAHWENYNYRHGPRPPRGRVCGVELWGPTICCVSETFMWVSVVAFTGAGFWVVIRGIIVLHQVKQLGSDAF